MSNPPITTTTTTAPSPPPSLPPLHHYHHHHHHHTQLLPTTTTPIRDYDKGNWTIQETLTLITAKKLNEDYRTARPTTTTPIAAGKLRWNWIEDYCWSQGCYRSQNQCNDKWDNLLRDYKKLRNYHQQPRSPSASNGSDSYWKMERHERKLNNLPSNMSREVYEALNEVVQRRSYSTNDNNNNNNNIPSSQIHPRKQLSTAAQQSPTPQVTIRRTSPAEPTTEVSEGVDSGETEEAEASDERESKLKKRRVGRRKISSSIKRSASKLAQTLKSCDGMKEKRHQQVMEMEQRRLHIEETRNQANAQGIASFVEAITNLSHSIHSIISNSNHQT